MAAEQRTPALVVGVDDTRASLDAVHWAVAEAGRQGLPVRLLHASVPAPSANGHRAELALAERLVATAAALDPGVEVFTELAPYDPVTALLQASREAFALVIAAHGHRGLTGPLPGQVSRAVAARADCPVVVVRGARTAGTGPRRIAVGVGEAEESRAALEFAFRLAAADDATVEAVRAWPRQGRAEPRHRTCAPSAPAPWETRARTTLDTALRTATRRHQQVPVRRITAAGPARDVLLLAASAADLLVVGAHRRAPDLGCLNHALLQHASCPVAVVPG
ncbi:universal stress protein [Streptomyces sp. A7024]|uniref:Universal stress protein n=1 Tax=Streptomyces coryli TaxID=1128680 RepID=A0A6G4TX22_9ACTN|nr:universal stress protein [Streptomyces coryli]NGN64525.1 universal stress protein [Streptomyces coryli]